MGKPRRQTTAEERKGLALTPGPEPDETPEGAPKEGADPDPAVDAAKIEGDPKPAAPKPDETLEAASSGGKPPERPAVDPDLPAEVGDDRQGADEDYPGPKSGNMMSTKGEVIPRSQPNKPSFDWRRDKKSGELSPHVDKKHGEEVVAQAVKKGVTICRTNRGRFIYLCMAAEYEATFGSLGNRILWEKSFPWAFEVDKKAAK